MANIPLNENFKSFFSNLNPDPTTIGLAAREHGRVTTLIESGSGAAAALAPRCFLQGSYKQQTAIHGINDVDVVALCALWQPGSQAPGSGQQWTRDQIFAAVASSIRVDQRYANRVTYHSGSMCIKVTGDVRIEVLPVVFASNNHDPAIEPFRLYRPNRADWSDGFARYHQRWLTWKNDEAKTGGNFIPAVKALKHIRTRFNLDVVSFHLECFLFSFADTIFAGSPADYLARLFAQVASMSAEAWYAQILLTPCKDRDIFTAEEWRNESWVKFHELSVQIANALRSAITTNDREAAVKAWQLVLGDEAFPHL